MEDKIIVYRTYYNPIEANIVKGRLEDSDIPCFLTDENVATIQPLYNQAIGGVKLNVFERDVTRINELLAEEENNIEVDNEIPTEDKVICDSCGSDNVSYGQATKNRFSWWVTILSIILFVYPFKANNCYHCYNCGHEFK
ncbi:DUF2007 domain-containing protein [Pedobacter sp. LMG 31464]|uniref:DUF2007 domain-containing protein n=1 Tax=Pedobacter planticolens TaxID=2679964 RepID=A0A923E412_9SPHI|nr:DUF2007 domain-containing protein [Pedobacter planticolens]MBB2147037.1 DUF2007 domain-containing protein [Pedobacter planticolens]